MPDKISVAVCGVGYWGKNLAKTFFELGVLKKVCDNRPEMLSAFGKIYKTVPTTASYSEILEDASINAVAVAVPTGLHHEFAKKALLAGKHVFVEKPIALKIGHAEELRDLADQRGLKLMVGHLLLYHPAVRALKEIIKSGELGKLYYIYTQRLNLGQIREDENVMWSLAPHDLSVVLDLFQGKPVYVQAHGYSYIQSHKGIEDVIFVNLKYKDGKAAHIHLSWLDPHKVRRVTLVGSRKMVVFDDMEPVEKVRVIDKGVDIVQRQKWTTLKKIMLLRSGKDYSPHLEDIEPLRAECLHFVDCIVRNRKPYSGGQNGRDVLEILEAATESLQNGGKRVRL